MGRRRLKCRDCGVSPGQIHKKGCDWEICSNCGAQAFTCGCNTEDSKRIPFGTVREIAARIPGHSLDHIEKFLKKDLSDAINKGLW